MRAVTAHLCLAMACASPEAAPGTERPATPPEPQSAESPAIPEAPAAAVPAVVSIAPTAFLAGLQLPISSHRLPRGAPHAIAHAPAGGTSSGPLSLIVFLHGWSGCARGLALPGAVSCREGGDTLPGWNLAGVHEDAGTDTALVVAQLSWLRRTGDPGRFDEPHFFERWLDALRDALAVAAADRFARDRPIGSITLVAHSAGFETALAILRHAPSAAPIQNVVMLDALYSRPEELAQWALADETRRVLSLYTGRAATRRHSRRLVSLVSAGASAEAVDLDSDVPLSELFESTRVVVRRSPPPPRSRPSTAAG